MDITEFATYLVKNIVKKALPNAVILAVSIMLLYFYFVFSGAYSGNRDMYRTIATYVLSLSAMIVLFEVCFPLNKYRSIVFLVASVLFLALFIWSIYGTNWLDLYPQSVPRYLSSEAIVNIVVVLIIILCAFAIKRLIIYLLANKNDNIFTRLLKKVKHEKHRRRN